MSTEETCIKCGRVDHPAYMCWRVGHLANDDAVESNTEHTAPSPQAWKVSASVADARALAVRVQELEMDNERLRRALQNITEFCVKCPDTAQFAARILEGRVKLEEE